MTNGNRKMYIKSVKIDWCLNNRFLFKTETGDISKVYFETESSISNTYSLPNKTISVTHFLNKENYERQDDAHLEELMELMRYYLNQCWLMFKGVMRHSPKSQWRVCLKTKRERRGDTHFEEHRFDRQTDGFIYLL